jgi:hypothetical protein
MTKAKEQSIKDKVRKISQARKQPFNEIWQAVILERWLVRLVRSPYRNNFIFKGAMCLRHYIAINKYSR